MRVSLWGFGGGASAIAGGDRFGDGRYLSCGREGDMISREKLSQLGEDGKIEDISGFQYVFINEFTNPCLSSANFQYFAL